MDSSENKPPHTTTQRNQETREARIRKTIETDGILREQKIKKLMTLMT